MLKVIIKNSDYFNDIDTNKHEFYTTMSKYQLFDWAIMNFSDNLRHELWDDLGLLGIDISDSKSVIIQVKEINSIKDIDEMDYIVKNKYIKPLDKQKDM